MTSSAVVVGLHQNGLGVVRALARHGVPVIAVTEASDAYSTTRYGEIVHCPDFRGAGLIATLRTIGERLDQAGILIATMDRSVLLLSEHRARLEPYFRHSLPDDRVVQMLMNKAETARYAAKLGLSVPRTYEVYHERDVERCIAEMQFPCILKPQVKTVEYVKHSPKKAFRIRSADELRKTYGQIKTLEPGFVVQEWIDGPDTNLIFALFYFGANDGRPVASFVGRKVRQFIPYCGTACSAEPWDDRWVLETGTRFFTGVNYRGFGAIEFKRDPQGRYHLIEPTVGRTEHIFALAAANGVNLAHIGYCDMAGLREPAWQQSDRRVRYVHWRRDFQAARVYMKDGELTAGAWLASLRGPKQFALWAWDDPVPCVHYVGRRFWGRPLRLIRRAASRLQSAGRSLRHAGIPRRRPTLAVHEPQAPRLHLAAAIDWLCAAQDASPDGGVARAYSLRPYQFVRGVWYPVGWQPSYPETTGYIIPTFFDSAARLGRDDLRARAIRMADWELTIQRPDGGIPGGLLDHQYPPVVFNTGMVLQGWCRAFEETGEPRFADAVRRAVDFLVAAQDPDGAWRRFSNMTPVGSPKAYDVRVAWAVAQAAAVLEDARAASSARANAEFALTAQHPNGWLDHNGLRPSEDHRPLTHTIAYAAEGLLECGRLLGEPRYVDAAAHLADAVLPSLGPDGFLPAQFDANWTPVADWSCLTGSAQMALVWLKLHEARSAPRYIEASSRVLRFIQSVQDLDHENAGIRGGIPGSFPMDARYGRYQYLNWAAKFFADALLLDEAHRARSAATPTPTAAASKADGAAAFGTAKRPAVPVSSPRRGR